MSSFTEDQQVAAELMDESEKGLHGTQVQQTRRSSSRLRNYCTEEYVVRFGVPIVIVLLLILFFALTIISIQKYNRNCAHSKGASCRGMKWFFT